MKAPAVAAGTGRVSGMAGDTPERPVYVRWAVDPVSGKILAGRVALAVAAIGLSILQGYLATRAQRAGASPDFGRQARMAFWLSVKHAADKAAASAASVSATAATRYNRERV